MTKKQSIESKKKLQEQILSVIQEKDIKPGDIFESKKALYNTLGLSTLKGSSSVSMDKIIDTILEYKQLNKTATGKDRFKIEITNIKDTPDDIVDNRVAKSGNSIYSKLIETILISYMINEDIGTFSLSYPRIYEILGMCNEYYYNYDARDQLNKYDKRFTYFELNSFFSTSSSLMKKTLIRALNSMKARSLIDYTKEIIILQGDKNNPTYRAATDEEIQIILSTQRQILDKHGYDNIYNAFMGIGFTKYYQEVNSILEDKYQWYGYYEQLKINTASKFYLERAVEKDLSKLKEELNINIAELVNNNTKSEIERENQRLEDKWKQYQEGLVELKGLYSNLETYKKMNKHKPDFFEKIQSILVKLFISLSPDEETEMIQKIALTSAPNNDLPKIDLLQSN